MISRRSFLKTIGLGAAMLPFAGGKVASALAADCSCNQFQTPGKKTNVIFIFADDLGYSDVGYHGISEVPTPHIDSIANDGAWFSAGYVTAPVCGPSRAGLLTGRYQQRFGAELNPNEKRATRDTKIGIQDTERTFGHRMQDLGYKTAFIGKHHAGKMPENNPLNLGFDYFFGFDNGASAYYIEDNPKDMLKRGHDAVAYESDYISDAFGRESVQFMEDNKTEPFFLYVAFNAVHGPMTSPPDLLEKYSYITDPGRRALMAMLDNLDTNVGRILAKVRSLGMEDDTLVFFVSDNGGDEEYSNFSYNLPLRDRKGGMYDGGIRIPFCMKWKNTIPAGQQFDFPVITLDAMPTMIAAANGQIDQAWNLDGRNLLPFVLPNPQQPTDRYLYWRFNVGWAIRDNTWKLVRPWGGSLGYGTAFRPTELYNLATDIGETQNVIDDYPEEASRLQQAWDLWSAEMIDPLWGAENTVNVSLPLEGY